jgi:hypothetical protein
MICRLDGPFSSSLCDAKRAKLPMRNAADWSDRVLRHNESSARGWREERSRKRKHLAQSLKIAILGGYAPRQSVGAVFRAFLRAGHDVVHWPTLPTFDPSAASRDRPDLLFTFKIGQENIPRGWVAAANIPVKVFWSFDDPHWISQEADPWIAREHGIVLTSCARSVDVYPGKGCPVAWFLPPAMDLEFYRDWKETRSIDAPAEHLVSFIGTNLYPRAEFPHTFIDRGEMVDRLTETFGSDFALFGYTAAIERKTAYRGVVHWEHSLPHAIEGTQMNVNSHVDNRERLYFNERFFQIASTRRAMFVDRIPGFVELFGKDRYIFYRSLDELIDLLKFYQVRPRELADIGQRGYDCLSAWTYDAFARQILVAARGGAPRPTFLG